ncbi:MAG: hypothetical protein JSR15_10015 [Proteobacteria bacterium]|nr:hypothetical protein [Pseudomonadota bacterium]
MITFGLQLHRRRCAQALATLLVLAVATTTCMADALASVVADFSTARGQFESGRAGSHDATERAQQLFSQLLRKDGDNPLYLAYYGSTFALQARDSAAPWTRIKLINQGNSLLDRALALLDHSSPSSSGHAATPPRPTGTAALETRLVAMATFIALPDTLFHRRAAAKREYQLAVASPEYASAPPDLQGHLQYEGALIAREEGDVAAERAALQRVLALNPQSVNLAEVRARLAELH